MSPPTREAWIEICVLVHVGFCRISSPPTREAWIEITYGWRCRPAGWVASHPGGVD